MSLGIAILLTCALPACSTSTTGADVPLAMLGASYGGAACGVINACYGAALLPIVAGTSSQAACVARAEAAYVNGALPRYQAAIAMHTLAYDGTQAQACVDAYRALGCGAATARRPGACAQLFIGMVAAGGACALNEECMGDAYCAVTTACPGTCQARGGSGAACTSDEACQTGLRCGGAGTRSCIAPAGDGASCQGSTGNDCSGGFICVGGNATTAGVCRSVTSVFSAMSGAACSLQNGQLCATGLSCVVLSMTNVSCTPGGIANGAACHFGVPDPCLSGSYCSGTNPTMGSFAGTCALLPTAGMPCAAVAFGPRCADGFTCDGSTCAQVVDNGGACTTDADCAGGRCQSNVCVAPTYCRS